MKSMSFAAKLLLVITVVLVFVTVKYVAATEVVCSDTVKLDEYNGCTVFYVASSAATYNKHDCINLTVGDNYFNDIEILDKVLLNSYIGNEQIVMYCLDLLDTKPGETAIISVKYRSLIEYISDNSTPIA